RRPWARQRLPVRSKKPCGWYSSTSRTRVRFGASSWKLTVPSTWPFGPLDRHTMCSSGTCSTIVDSHVRLDQKTFAFQLSFSSDTWSTLHLLHEGGELLEERPLVVDEPARRPHVDLFDDVGRPPPSSPPEDLGEGLLEGRPAEAQQRPHRGLARRERLGPGQSGPDERTAVLRLGREVPDGALRPPFQPPDDSAQRPAAAPPDRQHGQRAARARGHSRPEVHVPPISPSADVRRRITRSSHGKTGCRPGQGPKAPNRRLPVTPITLDLKSA